MNQSRSFFKKVYDITRKIPEGKVTTYGAIAKSIGSPQAARMVGWALNKCEAEKEFVPAHRVVNRNGLLTGKLHFNKGLTMEELLKAEGIEIENLKIKNFELVFWDPYKELI